MCPQTLRACLVVLGFEARDLFDAMLAARPPTFLSERRRELIWNETLLALAEVVRAADSAPVLELLTCEVPFWQTQPIVEPIDHLEHVVHPKRYVQEELLEFARGARRQPPSELEGEQSLLAIRAGPEVVVWFTPNPQAVLDTFADSYARDRAGTVEFVRALKRGL